MSTEDLNPKPATQFTIDANRAAAAGLPTDDRRDHDDATRGFIATLDDPVIRNEAGMPVIDLSAHDFVNDAQVPDTVHPSLWRHAQVNNNAGLFEVTDGIYQLRGLDLSNMTIVEGDEGIIVIDPLVFRETAAAALALYRKHRGDRQVKALIYTHSHADHYGGAKAIVSDDDVASGRASVIAPAGFLYEAVAENVYAGTAMSRRATYMYGPMLAPGVRGQVNAGLANALSNSGNATLVAPSDTVYKTGETRSVDGVDMVFQMAPGTEAPSEFLIHFPKHRALCAAEDATHTMHNLYTLRGAQVRDAATWWKTLNDTVQMFGGDTDVVFAQHHWPRWGTDDVREFLENQRDLYKYLHDQTLRQANHGQTMREIAEDLMLPAGLAGQWYSRGYYGSTNHNAKAVYQRYLGWYDSNPAHLYTYPPAEAGRRYVDFMGGADAVVQKAQAVFDKGDYRWVAEVLSHVVFAQPDHRGAALLQADAFEQLGYQCENPTWRNEYLMGAFELRNGVTDLGQIQLATLDVLSAMTPEMIFDYLGIRLKSEAAQANPVSLVWTVTGGDGAGDYALEVRNGCLIYTLGKALPGATTVRSTSETMAAMIFGLTDAETAIKNGDFIVDGDPSPVNQIIAMLDEFTFWFNIVQP